MGEEPPTGTPKGELAGPPDEEEAEEGELDEEWT